MAKVKVLLCTLLLALLTIQPVVSQRQNAQQQPQGELQSDSISVSLLTCLPGKKIYEIYGHTGIRIHYPKYNLDVVYHYGVFSFNTPNFAYRFVKGETDYSIGAATYIDFVTLYAARGTSVTELKLNLTQEEASRLFTLIQINMLPQNHEYRYSFLYDNCATRPRDMIVESIVGDIEYAPIYQKETFREAIHRCGSNYPWMLFGIDMLLGDEVDRIIETQITPFLPEKTQNLIANITVTRPNQLPEALVTTEPKYIVTAPNREETTSTPKLLQPIYVTIALLLVVIALSVVDIRRRGLNKILDTTISLIYGIMGLVVYYLLLISLHPAVSSNYNALWLHPIWIVIAILIWIKRAKKFLYFYHFINFAITILLLLGIGIIPQELNVAFIPLIAILTVRSITYIIVYRGNLKASPFSETQKLNSN